MGPWIHTLKILERRTSLRCLSTCTSPEQKASPIYLGGAVS